MASRTTGRISRTVLILGSTVALGVGAYAAYRYWRSREAKAIDEGFEDVSKLEENPEKKVLVLGLQSAGKSSVISMITGEGSAQNKPTKGFNITSLKHRDTTFNVWEICGDDKIRLTWPNFLQDTDILVYVVDAANTKSIPIASRELKAIMGDERIHGVPLLILANKQDLRNALTPKVVADALDVNTISSKNKVKVLGIQAKPGSAHSSIAAAKKFIFN